MSRLTATLFLLLLTTTVFAEETVRYDRISLSVEAGEDVDNDTLVAVLYAQQEGSDAEQISQQVNRDITEAVAQAKQVEGVRVQTLDYSTQPIYGKGSFSGAPKLAGWRVRQSIKLESSDAPVLSRLIGDLQQTLAVSNINYTVSPEQRKASQDRMIASAIASFKQRAELISAEMGRSGYQLIDMSINTSDYMPRPYQVRALSMESKMADAPPTLEAGTQRIQVTINGSIELKPGLAK